MRLAGLKKLTAIAVTAALFVTGIPMGADQTIVKEAAADVLPLKIMDGRTRDVKIHEPRVTNVFNREWLKDKIKNGFFASDRYFTYTVNGVNYDSRFVSSFVNMDAWRNMTESDREAVMNIYWNPNLRMQVFGDEGSQEMTKWYNDKTGWTEAWKILAQKIEDKYSNGLSSIYDSDDGGVDHYEATVNELCVLLDTGSYSDEIMSVTYSRDSRYAEEAEKIYKEAYAIGSLLSCGREYYNNGVRIKSVCWENSAKAVGQFTVQYIIDNIMTAYVRPKYPDCLKSGELLDDLAAQYWNVYFSNDMAYNELKQLVAGGEGVSLDKAVQFVNGVGQLAEKDFEMARFCYDKAVYLKTLCETRAKALVKKKEEDDKAAENWESDDPDDQFAKAAIKDLEDFTDECEPSPAAAKATYSTMYAYYGDYDELYRTHAPEEQCEELYEKLKGVRSSAISTIEGEYSSKMKEYEDRLKEALRPVYDKEAAAEKDGISKLIQEFPEGCTTAEEERLTEEYKDCIKWNEEYQQICGEVIENLKSIDSDMGTWWRGFYPRALNLTYAINEGCKNVSGFPTNGWYYTKFENYYLSNNTFTPASACYDIYGVTAYRRTSKEQVALTKIKYEEFMKCQENFRDYYQRQIDGYNGYAASYMETVADRQQLVDTERGFPGRVPSYAKNQRIGYGYYGPIVYAGPDENPELYNLTEGGKNRAKMKQIADELTMLYADYHANMALINIYESEKKTLEEILKTKAETSGLANIWDKGYSLSDYGLSGQPVTFEDDVVQGAEDSSDEDEICEEYSSDEGVNREHDVTGWFPDRSLTDEELEIYSLANTCAYIAADFKGYGNAQMEFMQNNYNYYQSIAPDLMRSGGVDLMETTLEILRSLEESPYTYAGAYANPGTEAEFSYIGMVEDPDGFISLLKDIEDGRLTYIPVESVSSPDEKSILLASGERVKLSAGVKPENATIKDIWWESFDESIASVDSNGNVTAKGPGQVKIRAMAKDCPVKYSDLMDPDYDDKTGGVYWTDFTVEVTGYETSVTVSGDSVKTACLDAYTGSAERVELPAVINELPLASLGEGAFKDNGTVKEISLPYSLEEIGKEAFSGCASLETLGIPGTVKSIGKDAFKGCTSLKEIYFGGSAAQWAALTEDTGLSGVEIHYSEEIPSADPRYVIDTDEGGGDKEESSSSTGGKGDAGSSAGGKDDAGSSTGGKDDEGSSTGGKGDAGSSTGGKADEGSSTGGKGDASSSTGGKGDASSSTGGRDDAGSSPVVKPTDGAFFASGKDNLAAASPDKKISGLILDFSNVSASKTDPDSLKMTVIKGSKLRTAHAVSRAQASDPGAVKVKRDKKTGCAVVTPKASGSVVFEMEDGGRYTVAFTVDVPKADKSKKKLAISPEKEVVYTVKDMFATGIDSGELTAQSKASQALVRENVLYIKPAVKDVISVEYKYLNKKYRLKISVK